MASPDDSSAGDSTSIDGDEMVRMQLFRAIMDHSEEGIVIADSENRIRFWNHAAETIFDLTSESFADHAAVKLCLELSDREALIVESAQANSHGPFKATISMETIDSNQNLRVDRSINIVEIDGEHWLLARINTTKLPTFPQSNHELLKLALTDELSGLLNRRGFQTTLEDNLHRQLALAIIDVDFFKRINDTQGHEVGDRAIKWIADKISIEFPDAICIGRLGGDEFGVVVEIRDEDSDEAVTEGFENLCFGVAKNEVDWLPNGIAVSIGVAIGFAGGLPARALLSAADKAMYQSKSEGRNRSTTFSVSPPSPREP